MIKAPLPLGIAPCCVDGGCSLRYSPCFVPPGKLPYELSAKQKQIEKDEKRIKELDRLFRKIYEDNVNGKLNDERFYKLSDGYEAKQEQLKQEIDIYYSYVGIVDIPTDEEMRELEREYMQRTKRQTA